MYLACLTLTMPCHVCTATRDPRIQGLEQVESAALENLIRTATPPPGNPPHPRGSQALCRTGTLTRPLQRVVRVGRPRWSGAAGQELEPGNLEDLDPACRRRPPLRHKSVVSGGDLRPLPPSTGAMYRYMIPNGGQSLLPQASSPLPHK